MADRGVAELQGEAGSAVLPRRRLRQAAPAVRVAEEILGPLRPGDDRAGAEPVPPEGRPAYAVPPGGELRDYAASRAGPIPDDLARTAQARLLRRDQLHGRPARQACSTSSTASACATTPSSSSGATTAGSSASTTPGASTPTSSTTPTRRCSSPSPGMKTAGKRTNALVEFVDIYPTLAELAGLPLPEHLEGRASYRCSSDPNRPWKPAAFSQYPRDVDGRQPHGLLDAHRPLSLHPLGRAQRPVQGGRRRALRSPDRPARERQHRRRPGAQAAARRALTEQWQAGWRGAGPTRSRFRRNRARAHEIATAGRNRRDDHVRRWGWRSPCRG